MFASRHQKGFTLIELLVVAVILGILAAVVVPQFGSSTDDTKASALKSNLATMRSAIDLYAQQHGGTYPGMNKSADGTADGTATDFANQLTKFSDAKGKTSETKVSGTDTYAYGPYLKEVPKDPVKGINTVTLDTTTTSLASVNAGTGVAGGWLFFTKVGRLVVNNSDKDNAGVKYDAY